MSAVAPIPTPVLRRVQNATPFPHLQFDKMGKGRQFFDVVVVCGSFDLTLHTLKMSAKQRGPVFADEYWDPAAASVSSLRNAGDLVLAKVGTDVYASGSAHAPDAKTVADWHALLRVERKGQPLIHKPLRFTGPRYWRDGVLGRSLTPAQPTRSVALRYELAYGGWWVDRLDRPNAALNTFAANPSGSGWFGSADTRHSPRARYAPHQPVAAPQIEYLGKPIRRANTQHAVAGLGPIARSWAPRLRLAGTYGAAWRKQFEESAIPDYPPDFDLRFFNCAPVDQTVAAGLAGDETLQMYGLSQRYPSYNADLPGLWLEATTFSVVEPSATEALPLDTVHIDLDNHQVHLTWRLSLSQQREVQQVAIAARRLSAAGPTLHPWVEEAA